MKTAFDMLTDSNGRYTETVEFEADKYYAEFAGRIVGPYDTEAEAWEDTGGDVAWIVLGEELDSSVE